MAWSIEKARTGALIAVLVVGCSDATSLRGTAPPTGASSASELPSSSSRAITIAARQAEAAQEPRYQIDSARLMAGNGAHRFTTTFASEGIKLEPASRDFDLALEVERLGCGGSDQPVTTLGQPTIAAPNR